MKIKVVFMLIFCLIMTSCAEVKNNFAEQSVVIENDGYSLNGVYSYIDDGGEYPAVLIIAGSGPIDYDGTAGVLRPYKDIADGLVRNGISTLRVDKRTFEYAAEFDVKAGIEEEYLSDCRAAVSFLKEQGISEIYLFGHSLGGQIAAEIAAEDSEIDGMILFNSSARHLADIACDQFIAIDPDNSAEYITYAQAAKNASEGNAKGYYYYSASDWYWVSYNKLDTIKSITDADIKTLIINSTADMQSFDADIKMWQDNFSDSEKVTIRIYDDMSHIGYKIDMTDHTSIFAEAGFPDELISVFSDFINFGNG